MIRTLHKKLYAFISINLFILFFALKSFAQAPTITSFKPNPVCQGEAITITGTNFTDPAAKTSVTIGDRAAQTFQIQSATTIVAYVDKDANSGSVSVKTSKATSNSQNITVNPAPQPVLTDQTPGRFSDFTNCSGSITYTLTVENNSLPAGGACTYNIDWRDNTLPFTQTDWQVGAQTPHTYKAQGYFKITLTINPANGCKKTASYNFYSGGNPVGGFGSDESTVNLCAPATISFKITGKWYNNTPGTYYYINWGDNTDTTLQHPLNTTNTDQVVKHTYTTTPCPYASSFTATFKAANGCVPSNGSWSPIGIGIKPVASFTVNPTTICINDPVCPDNNSTDGYSGSTLSCTSSTGYQWNFGDGSTSSSTNPACFTYNKPGTYKIKLSATSSCGTDDTIQTITVRDISATPTVTSPITYCQNAPAVPLKATGTNLLWYTTATGGTSLPSAPTPSTNDPGTTTYYVSQTISGQCESPRVPITVTVNALPGKPVVTSPVSLCKGQTAKPLTATGSNLLWYTTASGGIGSTTAPTPSTVKVDTTFYYVSQTTNTCEGERAEIQVIVSEIPGAPTVTSPVTYCQNQKADPLTATGTGLLWYTTATGGTGSSIPPTPVTSTPGKFSYYVSAGNYCGESPRTAIEVNVLAGPSATISYSKTVLCNSADVNNSNPPLAATITGSKGGTFSVSPSGLPINSTTGTITPAGATAATYIITYTIAASGGCSVSIATATITITGTPSATISYPSLCTSSSNANVTLNGTQGGTYTSTTGLSINASTGNINPSASTPGTYTIRYTIPASAPCPGFTTSTNVTITKAPQASISYDKSNLCNAENINNSNPPVKAIITGTQGGTFSIFPTGLSIDVTGTITPSKANAGTYAITYTIAAANGCSIYTTSTKVTVSSTPTASINYPAICSSDALTSVIFLGTQGGVYTTTSTDLSINASTGAIDPSLSKIGTYKVTYTIAPSPPCPGFVISANVTITKAPAATISYGTANLCNVKDESSTPNKPVAVQKTGDAGGIFTISPATGLPIDANTGTITPSEATAGTYTITYTIKGSGGCADFKTTTSIVINSTPKAAIQYKNTPFCSGSNNIEQVTLGGTPGGTYTSTTGLSINASTGEINPSLSKPGPYTITYTIAPSAPCPGYVATTSIVINESPSITFDVTSQSVCSGTTAVYKPTSTVANTIYTWSVKGTLPSTVSGVTSGTTSGPNAAINLSFKNTGTISETITVVVNSSNAIQSACAGKPYNLTLTINPIPSKLKGDTTAFCMHAPPMSLTATGDAGNTIKWYDENNNLLNTAPVINTINPAQFNFYATQTNVYGCESPSSPFIAIVHPVAKIVSSAYSNPTSCGIPSGSITLNVLDLNGNAIPNFPVHVHYTKFQTNYSVAASTDASGKIMIPLTAGTYSDIYVETFGCLSQKIPNVFVLKDPTPPAQPVAGYNAPLCSEQVFNLSASSPTSAQAGILNYVWVGPAFGNMPDTSQNTTVSFPSAKTAYNGIYIVYALQNNCISPATSFPVEIKQSPVKPVITTRTPLCVGDNLSLSATSSIIGNNTLDYVWNGPGTGFPVNSANASITNIKIEDGGVYSITVTSPQTGCSATADTLIQVGGYPVVQFSKDSFNVPTGYMMQLTPAIVNASDKNILPITKYEWSPPDNVQCNDAPCSLPTITVKKNICYTVKATNMYGCSGSDTVCIATFCNNTQVFIPNAFTPKGAAINSKFMVRASGIASVRSFRVFNRWGRIVFEKNNFPPNDPAYGWDGYVNGKLADMGVCVYTVEVVCENGIPYTYKGNVTLLQ